MTPVANGCELDGPFLLAGSGLAGRLAKIHSPRAFLKPDQQLTASEIIDDLPAQGQEYALGVKWMFHEPGNPWRLVASEWQLVRRFRDWVLNSRLTDCDEAYSLTTPCDSGRVGGCSQVGQKRAWRKLADRTFAG
jgi:hypothetical protein